MTEEERNLVLIDVAARLPYGVICAMGKKEDALFTERLLPAEFNEFMSGNWVVKPYLRPMSPLTDKEKKEYKDYLNSFEGKLIGFQGRTIWVIDFLISHHIDYRGLIEKGLALETEEGMYES